MAHHIQPSGRRMKRRSITSALVRTGLMVGALFVACAPVSAQTVSGVRSFDGGVGPLFNLAGPGSLYLDGQGTQGYLYQPGGNMETYSFRNPTTGQAWSGAAMTFGPQLSIGLIQGANQGGSPLVLPGPPRQTSPLPSISSTLLDEIP
ncbi:hypothetical protein [Nitrospira lenta]|uniref:Uncharacterized protein n=1 Tax=Nitrospira lenta TaxID=1436998 RepID=A0A330L716_9BACT|nr:hypothetical protein [Nitrospira lenta]SPP65697.1 exported hypothetical protein [Nitrospira lenta]